MRRSQLLLPTLKETPSDAEVISHQLMLRAGMIRQEAAGIYAWLPLGFRVMKKIEQIVREEQDRFGVQEILMPTIQSADLWRESGRYDDYGREMLRITDRHERDILYGPTNEEMVTDIFRASVRSYRQLPMRLYHIQWKFRDEVRPRFGVMRGREFLMKDAYSFDIGYEAAKASYDAMFCCYLNTFRRLGLQSVPVRADTGPIGGDLSHEFHVLADTGESELFCDAGLFEADFSNRLIDPDEDCASIVDQWSEFYATADEMHDPAACPVPADNLIKRRGIEVGHIFYFGTKYSDAMGARVADADGNLVPVEMGSYGVGVSRLVAAVIEASHDDNGIIWPDPVAPYDVGIIDLKPDDPQCASAVKGLTDQLTATGKSVLHDDRGERPGAKFAEMDLIGTPWQVIVGPRGLANGTVELKRRATGERHDVSMDAVLDRMVA